MITNVGQRLGERYVLRERLAVGGMGEVWAAVDEVLNRPVAVKVLRTDLAPDANFQARFRAEARTAAALSHGGIAAVYDYGEALGSAYLVMELVPGDPLSAMIADEGALGSDRTLSIVGQAARALHAAHRHGVIHRDIKPANLMVTPELRVKVTDFGIARPRDHEPLTATGQVMGTAHYLAPELARGETASPLSDVYALGVVAYECLTGWRPFEGDNQVAVATAHLQDEPPPLPETIPAQIRSIVMSAMAKNPAKRPQGADALASLMEDARLRGLGGPRTSAPDSDEMAAPVSPQRGNAEPAWPQADPAARRGPAPDRNPGPGRPTAWESRGRGPREQEQYDQRDPRGQRDPRDMRDPRGQAPLADTGYAPGPDHSYRRDPRQQQPSGYRPQNNGGYDQQQYLDSGYDQRDQRDQRSAYAGGPSGGRGRQDDDPFSSLGAGGDYPSRSANRGPSRNRATHGRSSQSGGFPGEASSGGRRKLSIPLIALIALVVLVAIVYGVSKASAATLSEAAGLRSGHVTSSVSVERNTDMVTSVGIRG
ncbi:protein kinase [Kineosporia rhizophila]|uniref:protein kinase domain-containing protein n=1 Tax=Kineosporia rhizophila TaxID=84633 RepID=UPI001E3F6504|nr:protein kinase [Kineosporia rhizophila]MCE0536902.1 protein kinase [Kineosporia rhizophila]